MAAIDADRIARHIAGLRRRFGPSAATVNTRISALRSFFRWANEQRPPLVRPGVDPTAGLRMRKLLPPPRAPLEAAELRSLLAAAASGGAGTHPVDRAVLMVLLDTGVRRSELLGIRERDVDWRDGTILIRDGKGGRPRLVGAGGRTIAALQELRNGGSSNGGQLWRLSKSGLKRLLDELAERAGLPPGTVYPHRLRVTHVCHLITQGVDAISVGVVAGHSLEMVRYYQRAIEQRRAVARQRESSLVDGLLRDGEVAARH